MKKRFLLSALIIGSGLFSLQASAMESCKIRLYTSDSGRFSSWAYLPRYFIVIDQPHSSSFFKKGDIIDDVVFPPKGWWHGDPQNLKLQIDHVSLPGSANAYTGNDLFLIDDNRASGSSFDNFDSFFMQKRVLKGKNPIVRDWAFMDVLIGRIKFTGLTQPVMAPGSWCQASDQQRYVKIWLDNVIDYPNKSNAFNITRTVNNKDEIYSGYLEFNHVDEQFIYATYDIIRQIGIDVPSVVNFGRVDTGVVAKQYIDVRLKYSGIPGRGILKFDYNTPAAKPNMEVFINENDDPQVHKLPYFKYLNGLPPDADTLDFQIGVKSDTTGTKEEIVRVTFTVF